MGSQPSNDFLDFLNEGIDGRTEYRFYWKRDSLYISFYVGADRRQKACEVSRPQAVTTAFRSQVRAIAAEIVATSRAGRVLTPEQSTSIVVSSTLDELVEAWKKEQILLYPDSYKTRHIQINNVVGVMKSMTDERTPLQRLVEDRGPQTFVNRRMRQRDKETVKKEVGVMFHFLMWLYDEKKFITRIPERPKYRDKDIGTRVGPQRDMPVHLDDETALRIINLLPEYGARGGRRHEGATRPLKAFVLRDWMRFAYETGLRPSTVGRLEVGVHWIRGSDTLKITAKIDKGRNAVDKGKPRIVPLTKVAKAILMKHAPEKGIVFGKHDIRVQWKRAACQVLGEEEGMRCSVYDLRHGANYRMRSTVGGEVGGAMHMMGHAKATTNDRYMRRNERAAHDVVKQLDARNKELEGAG